MRMIQKIPALPADAVVLDLEDSIPMLDKDTARVFIRDSIELAASGNAEVYVRVNGFTTGLTTQDYKFIVHKGLAGIILPKVETKEEVLRAERTLSKLEKRRRLKPLSLVPTLETARGVLNASAIATASKRAIALGFGAVDFTRDMATSLSKEGSELFVARSLTAMAARSAGIQALDTVFIDIADKEGLIRDSQFARQVGFKGKFLIHPSQIDPVNQVFSPSAEQVEYAKKIVNAYKEAEAKGLGAASLEGRMIDAPVYLQAKDLLSLAEAIAQKHTEQTLRS
jgi:citrate lyase subunit beta/citryl-CoA lyase